MFIQLNATITGAKVKKNENTGRKDFHSISWIVISYRNGFERKRNKDFVLLEYFYMINLPFSFKTSFRMFSNQDLIKKTPKSTG